MPLVGQFLSAGAMLYVVWPLPLWQWAIAFGALVIYAEAIIARGRH